MSVAEMAQHFAWCKGTPLPRGVRAEPSEALDQRVQCVTVSDRPHTPPTCGSREERARQLPGVAIELHWPRPQICNLVAETPATVQLGTQAPGTP